MSVEITQYIHENDVGTIFEVTVQERLPDGILIGVDLSSATLMEIKFQKHDNTVITRTAVWTTDGTDFKMQYTSVTDDLDQPGTWKLQGYIEMPTWEGHTTIIEFDVHENLE